MKVPAPPFLIAPETAVRLGKWLIITDQGSQELSTEVAHWDYQTELNLRTSLWIDRTALTEACAISWESGLSAIVLARSDRTKAEIVAARMDIPVRDFAEATIDLRLSGTELGGRLTIETSLVATEPEPKNRLAAHNAGSILWRSSTATSLEGIGTQFPTDSMDFSVMGLDPLAGWLFKIDLSDPEAQFMSAARLTLNASHPAISRLLSGAKDDRTDQIMRTLNWDVMRQMVQAAITSDDVFGMEPDAEATSTAGVLRNLLARIWPMESTATLRRWLESDPKRLEVRVQHYAGLLT